MGIKSSCIKLGIIIMVVLIYAGLDYNSSKNLENVLGKFDVSLDLNKEYIVKDYDKTIGAGKNIIEISATFDKDITKIKIIYPLTDKEALRFIENQRYMINTLFSKQKVPYPGPLTNLLECPEQYLPKIEEEQTEDSERVFYSLYANNRLTFGGCTEDVLAYAAVLAFIYCKEKNEFYQIGCFTPKENPTLNYKEIVKSFKCRKEHGY